jgi:phage antirepressor YoqD-like protein
MNNAVALSTVRTMTTREIAELTSKRHDNVMADTAKMLLELYDEDSLLKFKDTYVNAQNGVTYSQFKLPKRESLLLVSGYSLLLRVKIIDRWTELEEQVKPSNLAVMLSDPAYMRSALLEFSEKLLEQQQKLTLAAPKVEFVDKYVDSGTLKGFRQVAKVLGIKENVLREFLINNKIMYKLQSEWTAYQVHIDAGRFSTKTGVTDTGHAFFSCMFTPKGVTWLAGEIAKDNIKEKLQLA